MMTRNELLEIIPNGENSGVEFKRDTLHGHDLARELVAFSNLQGGMVLLGVDEDGSIEGVTRDGLKEWVMSVCGDKIRPAIIPFFEVVENVERGRDVAIVRVLGGPNVYSRWHDNRNSYYVRVGSKNRELTREELSRMFDQRGTTHIAHPRPISGATVDDLDLRRIKDYFRRVREQDVPEDNEKAEWKRLLVNIGIMDEEGVTLPGILLFGKTPNRFLPQAGIDAVAFQGTEKDSDVMERAALQGPMMPLSSQADDVFEPGLVERALYFVRRNTRATAVLKDGARRVEKRGYPDEAVREAVVNALIHRNYVLAGSDIKLAVYHDRLEVVSPGGLFMGMNLKKMRTGTGAQFSRNHLLTDVMRHYGYADGMGRGVSRKIVRAMKDHNGTGPDLVEEDEKFIVRLFSGNEKEG